MNCTKCGGLNAEVAVFCQSCGASLGPGKTRSYGSMGNRFVAALVDNLLVLIATGVLAAVSSGIGFAAIWLVHWLYDAFMMSSERQATFGKQWMGLRVTTEDGQRLSFARATGRHFAKYVSAFLLMIGYIMAFFTDRRQALHDMMASTLVMES